MKNRMLKRPNATGGFTLVEVLVSITVLGLMMVGVAQMLNSAMTATLGSYKHIDADTQARMVLDRMAYDISKITKRSDVDYYFQKNTGNDQMAFFSEAGGYYPSDISATASESSTSLVGYQINSNSQMERLSKGLIWNGVTDAAPSMVYLPQTIASTWPLVKPASASVTYGTDTNFQVIGDQIFRLEYCFLVQNRFTTSNATTALSTTTTLSDTPYVTPDTSISGMQDVVAVVVSIAVLDAQSRAIVSNATMQTAAGNLADVSGSNIATSALPSTVWKAKLLSNGLGLPKAAASQVRFYQRYCYLTHIQQ
jgi:prepilin-type N-terminal cleavage/methylation domain-containing protein